MAVFLTPTFGAGYQGFTNPGIVNSGGKLYTYTAGTTTPVATYNSSTGSVPNANPIILDSTGRIPTSAEMWQTGGTTIKVLIQDSSGNTLGTYDNLQGLNDPSFLSTGVVPLIAIIGDSLVSQQTTLDLSAPMIIEERLKQQGMNCRVVNCGR